MAQRAERVTTGTSDRREKEGAMDAKRPVPLIARVSLRAKVTVLLLALSLTPVLVAGVVTVHRAQEEGERGAEARYGIAASATARALGELAERTLREARFLARRFPVEIDLAPARLPDRAALVSWEAAGLIHEFNDAEQTTFVALADGRVAFTVPFRNVPDLDLRAAPWFLPLASEGGLVAAELPGLTSPGQPGLIALAPIIEGGRHLGHVGIVVHASRLAELVRPAAQDIEGPVEVFDATGTLVTAGHDPQITMPLAELFAHHAPPLFEPHRPSGVLAKAYADDVWLVAWAAVDTVPLTVQFRVPADVAYRHVYVLSWLLIAVIVLTFMFVVLFADHLATVLLRPIHELERGAEMLGAGQLDFRIEVAAHAHDELGRLAGAFNRMGERLQGSLKEVRAYSRSLETANEELDALVHGITHDLKKSLRNIQAFATFLHEGHAVALGDEGRALARSIVQVVDRLDVFTDDLIKLVERERVRGEASRFPLRTVVEEARARVLERRVGEVVIADDLPELNADRLQLVMLFDNLIDNGLKFNHSPQPRVEVRCLDDGPDWRIEVEDNGIGIEARYHQQIFELFRRLNPPDEYAGAGTGLNLVRRIVEDHRGTVSVRSAPGEGTCISITLPKEPMLLTLPGIRL
jgi:signal transduction histidine kinase